MITNGHVMIEDGVKAKEEYAPARKVQVHIGFSIPEGVDNMHEGEIYVTAAGDMANAHVNRLLGREPKMAARPGSIREHDKTTDAVRQEVPAGKEGTPKKAAVKPNKEKTKADLAAEAGLPATDTVHKGNPPSQMDLEELTSSEAPEASSDDLGDLLGETAPAPVTDAELGKAASTKNGALATKHGAKYDPTAIRKLVSKYNGEVAGKKLADIPAAKRHEFLKELDALS